MYIKKQFLVEARQYLKNKNFKEIIEFLDVDLLLDEETIKKEELTINDIALKNKDFVVIDSSGSSFILSEKNFRLEYQVYGTTEAEEASQEMEAIFTNET